MYHLNNSSCDLLDEGICKLYLADTFCIFWETPKGPMFNAGMSFDEMIQSVNDTSIDGTIISVIHVLRKCCYILLKGTDDPFTSLTCDEFHKSS